MPRSVRQAASSLPLNSRDARLDAVDRRCAKASIGINSADDDASETVVSLVFLAIAACGMSDKEAAYTMGIDPAQLSRIKNGQGRLPIDALWRMPDHFWLRFRDVVDEARNLSGDVEKSIRAARIGELVRLLVEEVA